MLLQGGVYHVDHDHEGGGQDHDQVEHDDHDDHNLDDDDDHNESTVDLPEMWSTQALMAEGLASKATSTFSRFFPKNNW